MLKACQWHWLPIGKHAAWTTSANSATPPGDTGAALLSTIHCSTLKDLSQPLLMDLSQPVNQMDHSTRVDGIPAVRTFSKFSCTFIKVDDCTGVSFFFCVPSYIAGLHLFFFFFFFCGEIFAHVTINFVNPTTVVTFCLVCVCARVRVRVSPNWNPVAVRAVRVVMVMEVEEVVVVSVVCVCVCVRARAC